MSSAYLLVSHGSRDPRPEMAMQQLAGLISQKLTSSLSYTKLLDVAHLEMSSKPLHEQIQQFAKSTFTFGCVDRQQLASKYHLKIVPLFLLPGVHVMTDIPEEVGLAQQALGQDVMISLQPYLGSHPDLGKLLAKPLATIAAEAWILLSHGSRRPNSQQLVEAMAANLGAIPAYWAGTPNLESRVKELIAAGYREIAILPYFLFAGGITDAIAKSIEKLKLQFPAVTLQLAEPLGVSTELADLIWDLMQK